MPTILTHAAFGLALGAALSREPRSPRFWFAMAFGPVVPDLDWPVVRWLNPDDPFAAIREDPWGHRGATHSLAFAIALGLLTAFVLARDARPFATRGLRTAAMLALAISSHGALDAFTNGGEGIAFLWPFTDQRWFWPARPIEVAPLSVSGFFTARGWDVMRSELLWVWAPTALALLALLAWRRAARGPSSA